MNVAELFVQISVSVDGFIEDRNRDIEWMTSNSSFDARATATLQSIDGMIFGRKAHELLATFWPGAADTEGASADLIAQTQLMNTLPKYVLTHGEERTGWANSYAITLSDIPRLKQQSQRPIAVYAGASAVQAVLDAGFVDEIQLIRYPVLLGGGTPLFADGGTRRDLVMTGSEPLGAGVTLDRYRFAL